MGVAGKSTTLPLMAYIGSTEDSGASALEDVSEESVEKNF
jgi:hypothetical protein